ncbi:MAG: hypothetical protein H2049_08105 [Porphyrobacter sp.]|nr:hypothetical protein [Porphyrobacter sp.]
MNKLVALGSLPWLLLIIAGCNEQRNGEPKLLSFDSEESWLEHYSTPQYGEERSVSGKYFSAFEASTINLCDDRSNCPMRLNVDGSLQTCWVEFAPSASVPTRVFDDKGSGSYWLSGTGRIAVLPGSFGHLGGYTCQVEMTKIDKLEESPTP